MAENKQKKDRPPVRVSPELKMLIEGEASRQRIFEYEVLDQMWVAYQNQRASAIPRPGNAEIPKSRGPGSTDEKSEFEPLPRESTSVQSGLVQIWVTDSDYPTVRDLLRVLHSPKPGLAQAIKNNMHEFVWVDQAWNELAKHKSPLVSAEEPRGRGPGTTPIDLQGADGNRERGEGDAGPDSRITGRIDALEEAERESDSEEEDAPGETGTGS